MTGWLPERDRQINTCNYFSTLSFHFTKSHIQYWERMDKVRISKQIQVKKKMSRKKRFLTMFTRNDDQQRLIKWKWETTQAQIRAPLTTKTLISWRYRRCLPAWLRVCMAGVGNHQQSCNQSSLCTSLIIQRTPMDTVCLRASNQPESHHEWRQKERSVCTRRAQKHVHKHPLHPSLTTGCEMSALLTRFFNLQSFEINPVSRVSFLSCN